MFRGRTNWHNLPRPTTVGGGPIIPIGTPAPSIRHNPINGWNLASHRARSQQHPHINLPSPHNVHHFLSIVPFFLLLICGCCYVHAQSHSPEESGHFRNSFVTLPFYHHIPNHRNNMETSSTSTSNFHSSSSFQQQQQQTAAAAAKPICATKQFELYDGHEFVFHSHKHRSNNTKNYLHYDVENLPQCLRLCLGSAECEGVNYDGLTCQQLDRDAIASGQLVRSNGKNGKIGASFVIHGRKICIADTRNNCDGHTWAFEHVIGHQLSYPGGNIEVDYYQRNQVTSVRSLDDCRQLCLDEQQFVCRSALYNASSKDCVLSDMNRHTIDTTYSERIEPIVVRNLRAKFTKTVPFSSDIHYIENKCHNEPRKFCDFRRLKNHQIKTADLVSKDVDSFSECRELCISKSFCKSFDYDTVWRVCRISHLSESSAIHIEEPYFSKEEVTTYEISTCYNVSIFCEPRNMKVQIETSKLFNGKIYAKSQPKQCVDDVTNRLQFDISMPYFNRMGVLSRGAREQSEYNYSSTTHLQCDTRQPDPGNFANDIVIQHHDLVMTTKDLSLGVYCKFDLKNESIARIDLKIQGDILTDRLKGVAKLPDLSLHIVDYKGRDIDEVSIGDVLRVQVRLSDEATYGIFVRNLIATDSFNRTNNFTLIDSKGCPVEVKMMREMRTIEDDSKSLESYFEAFSFTGGSLLLIEAEVETCLDKCKPVQCQVATGRSDDDLEIVTSFGRRRRRSVFTDIEQAEKGDIVSMTMLTKSLLIKPDKSSGSSSSEKISFTHSLPNHFSTTTPPNQTPNRQVVSDRRKLVHAQQNSKSKSRRYHSTFSPSITPSTSNSKTERSQKSSKSLDLSSPFFKISIADKSYICFEPMNLFIICCISFCIQGFVFSLVFYILIRIRLSSHRDRTELRYSATGTVSAEWPYQPSHHRHSQATRQPYNHFIN